MKSGGGLTKALRSGDGALKKVAGGPSRRTFTSSAICQKLGGVPAFSQTSSPELDTILSTFRTKIFLPVHLSKQQRDLIYKQKNQRLLSAEPVTAHINGEEFHLEHIDRTKDLPSTRLGFFQAVKLMKDKKDWDQIPILLEGLRNAKINFKQPYALKLIKKAALAGRMDVVIECARRVSSTGMRLNDPELVAAIMWGIQYKAIVSDFSVKETKQALSWAEMILVLLEEEKHAGRQVLLENDPRKRFEVAGALLQLAAVRSARHLDGKDEDGIVAKSAERLLGTKLENQPPQTPHPAFIRINRWLTVVVPVLHGMKVAQTILDPASQVAGELKETVDVLEATVKTQRQRLMDNFDPTKESMLLGLKLYDQLLGKEVS